jgi:hypothetical protein
MGWTPSEVAQRLTAEEFYELWALWNQGELGT